VTGCTCKWNDSLKVWQITFDSPIQITSPGSAFAGNLLDTIMTWDGSFSAPNTAPGMPIPSNQTNTGLQIGFQYASNAQNVANAAYCGCYFEVWLRMAR